MSEQEAPESWIARYRRARESDWRTRIPDTYVDPCVTPADGASEASSLRLNRYLPVALPPVPSLYDERQTALVVLRDPSRPIVVLLGDPGSGKTSALYVYLQELTSAAIADPAAPVPLLVDLTDADTPILSLVPVSLDTTLEDALDRLRKRKRTAIVLFDGLDRASARFPAELRSQIAGLVRHAAVERLILTCQRAMWSTSGAMGSDTAVYTLLPFRAGTDGEVTRYLKQRFGDLSEAALRLIEADSRLHDMVSSPILLGLIADLLAPGRRRSDSDGTRSSILGSWIEQQVDALTPDNGWYRDGRRTLEDLAHLMTARDRLGITWDDLATSELTGDRQLQELLDTAAQARALAGTGHAGRNPYIRFVHQTFQEYYASGWILRRLEGVSDDELRELVSDTRWDEPFLLALEREKRPEVITTIVARLLTIDPLLLAQALKRVPLDGDLRASCGRLVAPALRAEARWLLAYHAACELNDDALLPELTRLAEAHAREEPSLWDAIQTLSAPNREQILRQLAASSDAAIRRHAELALMFIPPAGLSDLITRYASSSATEDTNAVLPALAFAGTPEALDTLLAMARRGVGTAPGSRHPAAALALVGSDGAWQRLSSLFDDASIKTDVRDSCVAAVASADESLCLEIGLRRARQRAKSEGWPLDTSDEEMLAVVEAFKAKWPRHARTPAHVRDLVLVRMMETGEWVKNSLVPDPTRVNLAPPPRADLWYRAQRSLLISTGVREHDVQFLVTECLRDEIAPGLLYDVLRTLAAIDPIRAVSAVQSYLSQQEKMPVAVAALGPYVSKLPESWTGPMMETYRQCDELWTSGLARCVSLLSKTDQLVVELVALLDSGPDVKVLDLMSGGVFWRDNRLIDGLRQWVKKAKEPDKKMAGLGTLAMLADADALSELTGRLPAPFNEVSARTIAARSADLFFPEWVAMLVGFDPSDGEDWQVLGPVAAGLLACIPNEERGATSLSWKTAIPPQHRWFVYFVLQFLSGRRTYELIETGATSAEK